MKAYLEFADIVLMEEATTNLRIDYWFASCFDWAAVLARHWL